MVFQFRCVAMCLAVEIYEDLRESGYLNKLITVLTDVIMFGWHNFRNLVVQLENGKRTFQSIETCFECFFRLNAFPCATQKYFNAFTNRDKCK